jgi:hypothetical protein
MTIDFLNEFFLPVVAGICLCAGYVMKTATSLENRYIPAINALLGLALSLWIHWGAITPAAVLSGLFSGLSATGLYEAFRNMIGGDAK